MAAGYRHRGRPLPSLCAWILGLALGAYLTGWASPAGTQSHARPTVPQLSAPAVPALAHVVAAFPPWTIKDERAAVAVSAVSAPSLPLPAQYLHGGKIDQGVDYLAPGGTPLYAMGPGVILQEGGPGTTGFGPNIPVLQITSGPLAGRTVYYGHAGPNLVPAGTVVAMGQQISVVGYGQVGRSSAPHLEIGFWPLGGMRSGQSMMDYLDRLTGEKTGR